MTSVIHKLRTDGSRTLCRKPVGKRAFSYTAVVSCKGCLRVINAGQESKREGK
jgi:hypothetical protein